MPRPTDDTENIVWISVPLDGETAARLLNLSDVCHAEPVSVAASLLHDILKDDEIAHTEPPPSCVRLN
jgi:hypothetical protein